MNKRYNNRIYPHQKWDLPEYNPGYYAAILNKLENKEKLTREEKDGIFNALRNNTYSDGQRFMIGGYYHDFSGLLKKFYVEYKDGSILKLYAFDKTSIRTNDYTKNGILNIVAIN